MAGDDTMDATLQIVWEFCNDGMQNIYIYIFFFLLDFDSFKSLQGFFYLLPCLYAKKRETKTLSNNK